MKEKERGSEGMSVGHMVKCTLIIALWYGVTIAYNIINKRLLIALPYPATLSMLQLGMAVPFILASWWWHYRGLPPISSRVSSVLVVISLLHALGMYFTSLALIGGAVSFVHIVKAAEPAFAAVFSYFISKKIFPLPVYLALVPIVGGVCFSSAQDISFSVLSFSAAICSNCFFQLRMILSKQFLFTSPQGGMDKLPASLDACSSNTVALTASLSYRIMTVVAFLQLVPITLMLEGSQFIFALNKLQARSPSTDTGEEAMSVDHVLIDIFLSGLCYFVFSEASFTFLELVHPLTHAVASAVKRVAIVSASIIVFNTPLSPQVVSGATLAILGTVFYSVLQHRYKSS